MSKGEFQVGVISANEAAPILKKYHYLSSRSRGFRSGYNYGLFHNSRLVGVAIFTGFSVPELAKGMLGLERTDQEGLFELSRLCLVPEVQETEHNLASWFLARALRQLRKDTYVRVVLAYADSEFHEGTVYKASNFKYYGLTDKKSDFWLEQPDGTFRKHSRGKVRGLRGEWRPRSRKHRFALCFDPSLAVLWKEVDWPERKETKC